jgi:tetratricopeptide (TPR) repeat protein
MLDEILSISGNRAVYDALVENLSNEKAVAFVGAGASAGIYPLWGELIEQLADYAVAQGKAEPGDAERWKRDKASTAQQRVRNILRKLEEPLYFQFLRQKFSERRGSDGKRFTATHAALLRIPFRGYVTTNYDPALDFARAEIRPECLTTGIPTWQDDDEVYRWLSGEAFAGPEDCPILWLHGSWQRPSGIVLNAGEYGAAYKPGIYRNTFRKLWEQDRLVFVGFGFNDPQFTFMVGEILRDIAGAHPVPRHIAILALRPDGGAYPDNAAIAELRAGLEEDYHVRPLFYHVKARSDGGEDHGELLELLDTLAPSLAPPPPPAPAPPAPVREAGFTAHWRHEPTDDEKFTGRDDEQQRLDRWVRDEAVRVIGVSAVGGTGKTALVAHWLKNTEGWKSRPFAGLFAWSFYRERDTTVFVRELIAWAHDALDVRLQGSGPASAAVVALIREVPIVLVLDGLEVLQEGPDDPRHGAFLDGALRELLVALCSRLHRGVAVLTSRFMFADLEQFAGTAFHQLNLAGLMPEQGAALLADLGVGGSDAERKEISERLEGHPLGLRVFAEALPEALREEPLTFVDNAFAAEGLTKESALTAKVRRLLAFYEEKLPQAQVRLLSVVALFRAPVPADTITRIMRGLFGDEDLSDDALLTAQISRLHNRGVLTRDPIDGGYGYACHPILRDHFRSVLVHKGAETARRNATTKTLANLAMCEEHRWKLDCGLCHAVLSQCALAEGRMDDAREHLGEAESIFRRGQVLFELGRLQIVAGRIALADKAAEDALERAAEALSLAQPRGMRLEQADALVVRGRARLMRANIDPDAAARALDDAEEALRIARDCGYAWAERDALRLQGASLLALADAMNEPAAGPYRAYAERTRAEAGALSARLRLTEEDLREADLKAAAWFDAWETQHPPEAG